VELLRRSVAYEAREVAARTLRFVASDESIDRHRTIIKQDGWILDNFRKNPVLLWMHNAGEPIGHVVRSMVEDGRLMADAEFADDPLSDRIYKLYKAGALRAVSVGFRALETREPSEDEKKSGVTLYHTRQELFELSAVSIPSNPNALIQTLGLSATPEEVTEELVARAIGVDALLDQHDAELEEMAERGGAFMVESLESFVARSIDEGNAKLLAALDARLLAIEGHLARLVPVKRGSLRTHVDDELARAVQAAREITDVLRK
jgi:HK97 family phage prohead protease